MKSLALTASISLISKQIFEVKLGFKIRIYVMMLILGVEFLQGIELEESSCRRGVSTSIEHDKVRSLTGLPNYYFYP
jgi:hypothetical protein